MKEEVNAVLDFVKENLQKYGWIVALCVLAWLAVKKLWFWIILPILGIVACAKLFHETYSITGVICGWIFIFSIAKIALGGLFENETKKN